ncbi:CHRD domain-containing protein [Sinorhizobium numidicum]|uniref:CHRD domain-containing protein n=1 Tax=Sinorhizobium numidicum TaxID=680248 RepID=UPI00314502A0
MAETLKFRADLRGSSEVPPADSAGTGTGDVAVDTETKKLTWTVNASGLSGNPTAAHFHGPAAAGENADPVVDISGAIASGSADITDQHLADLQAGRWYLNIHTEKFPDGEIRGQVEKAQ